MPLYPTSCLKKTVPQVVPRKPNAYELRLTTKNYFLNNNNNPGDLHAALFPSLPPAPRSRSEFRKRVTFAPNTPNYDRETKPYKYHNLFRKEIDGAKWGWLKPKPENGGAFFNEQRRLQLLAIRMTEDDDSEENENDDEDSSSSDDPEQSSSSKTKARPETPMTPTPPKTPIIDNDYIHFTHAKKNPDYLMKGLGATNRSRRLYQLTTQLKKTHQLYNAMEDPDKRDTFLVDEILQRYIMVLDLALTEGYIGFALELTHAMYDTTKYMLPLYSHIFYNSDGSHTVLPILVQESPSFIIALPPVIYALNRISENRSRSDNTGMNLETLLMKLQLEMITLTISPVQSVIFRAVLEIVSGTAFTAYTQLSGAPSDTWIKWVNNSNLRNDYIGILRKLGMADKIGCKGTLHGIEVQRSIAASVYKADLMAQKRYPELPNTSIRGPGFTVSLTKKV